jgi:hypothetical protein
MFLAIAVWQLHRLNSVANTGSGVTMIFDDQYTHLTTLLGRGLGNVNRR